MYLIKLLFVLDLVKNNLNIYKLMKKMKKKILKNNDLSQYALPTIVPTCNS